MNYILLVEDDPSDAELALASMSADARASVVLARDGAEALRHMLPSPGEDRKVNIPGLVVLDLKMPKLDGFEVLRAMRAAPALAVVPVVVATGSREERDLVDSWRLGVNGVFEKPIDLAALVDLVRREGLLTKSVSRP